MQKKVLNYIIALLALFSIAACQQEAKKENVSKQEEYNTSVKQQSDMRGLAEPFQLNYLTSKLHLSHYFNHPENIDSIYLPNGLTYQLVKNSFILQIEVADSSALPALSCAKFTIDSLVYTILLKKSKQKKVTFKFPFIAENHSVSITGQMNNWNKTPLIKQENSSDYEVSLFLNPGIYQYKFLVDGKEKLDPYSSDSIRNSSVNYNNWIQVGENMTEYLPFLYTFSYSKDSVFIKVENNFERLFITLQNQDISPRANTRNQLIALPLPKNVNDWPRSYIRCWASNEYGVSNDLIIPITKEGLVLQNSTELNKNDPHSLVLYKLKINDLAETIKLNDNPYFQSLGFTAWLVNSIDQSGVQTKNIYPIENNFDSKLDPSSFSSEMFSRQNEYYFYDNLEVAIFHEQASFDQLVSSLENALQNFGHHHLLGNNLRKSDQEYLITDFNNEIIKQQKTTDVKDSTTLLKLALIFAFNSAIPGIPVINCGEELGLVVEDDLNYIKTIEPKELSIEQQQLQEKVVQLNKLRSSNMALIFGETRVLFNSKHQLILERSYFNHKAMFCFNKEAKSHIFELDLGADYNNENFEAHFVDAINNTEIGLEFELKPYSFAIFIAY